VARRKDHVVSGRALLTALHNLRAFGARSASVRQIAQHLGTAATSSAISALQSANSTLVSTSGGKYKLTDAGLAWVRSHPSDRSYAA
jgi:uncharacterized protein YjhX (UPF0386 family)